jgi:lipopolysaccharide export system protein LptA
MPLPIYRLRRLLAATAILLTVMVTGMYIYARMRIRDVRKDVGSKLPFEISQTANGFRISKSDGKRTLFTVEASNVTQFKLNGNAELHNVNIIVYGHDSSRFDQISGDVFSYDQKTGNITAKGEVQIDLVANPAGVANPDQTAPKVIKNPIHVKTRDLVFNKDSGDAATDARVDFNMAQASGWAVGAKYIAKQNMLTLATQVHVALAGPDASVIEAEHGVITSDPRQVVLDRAHLDRKTETAQSDQAIFRLGPDNSVQSVLATGNVTAEVRNKDGATGQRDESSEADSNIHGRADQGEFELTKEGNLLRSGVLTGHVHIEQGGAQPMQGDAPRAVLEFVGENELRKVHAMDGVRLLQKGASSKQPGTNSGPQDFELTAQIIDFDVAEGNILTHAETTGPAQIRISPSQQATQQAPSESTASASAKQQQTVVTAGKFTAKFDMVDGRDHLSSIHGAPEARIVTSTTATSTAGSSSAAEPDRISTSDSVDGIFLGQGGIESITQSGHVFYTDQQAPDKLTQAWANSGKYTPADQMLVLTGSPRVASGAMVTTAKVIRMNRATGDALAEGDVKSTYSEMKEQPDGALLASSSPVHVTARTMTSHKSPGIALYTGNARLWQDANIIEAPSIEFDRERRFVTAQGTNDTPVLTTLVQADKTDGKSDGNNAKNAARTSPVAITGMRLTYADAERKAHYEGGVKAKGVDFTAVAKSADAYLVARSQVAGGSLDKQASEKQAVGGAIGGPVGGPAQLDHLVAVEDVHIQQPGRQADGQKLVYTASDDKFVLTGGPPSIFDAEQGKITGVSLTFFRGDDRVLVEGEANTPVVTKTRVTH